MAGFRLNPKTDNDIIKELENAKDQSKRIKELLRLGIKAEAMGKIGSPPPPVQPPTTQRLTWSVPKEPTVKQEQDILAAIKKENWG